MERKLKTWQGWLLFAGTMVVVFVLGLVVASMLEHRAEVASVFNNKKVDIKGIEPRNEIFKDNYPREYATWLRTAETDFKSEFNGSEAVDVLAQRPEMVILWAGYAFSKDYTSLADTCMPLRMCIARSAPVHLLVIMMVRSRLPAGLAKVRTYHG